MPASETCTREGCQQPRANGKPWCLSHLAQYQRNYRGTIMDMSERKGFAKGVEALRKELIEQFTRPGIASGSFDGLEIAHLIRGVKIEPAKKEEKAEAQTP